VLLETPADTVTVTVTVTVKLNALVDAMIVTTQHA
jgi:hypothetical protein